MKIRALLEIEKRLIMQMSELPLQVRLMLKNMYEQKIKFDKGEETEGQEEELFWLMEELLNEHQDIGTGS